MGRPPNDWGAPKGAPKCRWGGRQTRKRSPKLDGGAAKILRVPPKRWGGGRQIRRQTLAPALWHGHQLSPLEIFPPPFGDFWLRWKGGGIFLRGQKCPFRPTPHHAFEGPIFLRGQKCPSLLHDFFAPAARFYH